MVEYEACAMGITMAIEHQVKKLKVFGDSTLVIYQLHREWETRNPKLIPYHSHITTMGEQFDEISFHYVPRDKNQMVDALETLSSMLQANQGREMTIHIRHKTKMAHYQQLEEAKRTLRRLVAGFFLSGVILYKRSANLILLCCVDDQEAQEIMEEVHEGTFGTHTNGYTLTRKILKVGYYWAKMESNYCQNLKRCMKCQVYADNIHVAPSALHNLTSPWSFSMWGLDMIGPIEPKASNGHRFILVAIYYFTKWVKAASYTNVTKSVVVKFIKRDII
ncbi:Gypsy retrotransposon integrase-like protein 1, partial [Mucuna pruriens]